MKKYLNISILATLAAFFTHLYLTQHYYGVTYGLNEGTSVCNINAFFNCDAVTLSRFSAFKTVPLALLGAFTNLILLLQLLVARFNLSDDSDRQNQFILLSATLILSASIVMGSISFALLGNACLFCILTYGLSILQFIMALIQNNGKFPSIFTEGIPSLVSTNKGTLAMYVIIPLSAYLTNSMILDSYGLAEIERLAKEKVSYWASAPPQNFDLNTGLKLQKGTGPARLVLVEFADFRCPHCRHAIPALHKFTERHPDVLLIFKPFPLDGTCNASMKSGGDGVSCGLAFLTMCAEKMVQKGWEVHDYIFDHQDEIHRTNNLSLIINQVVEKFQLSRPEVEKCLQSEEIIQLVKGTAAEGEKAQIGGTPTVFANGKLLQGGQLIPVLEEAYRTLPK